MKTKDHPDHVIETIEFLGENMEVVFHLGYAVLRHKRYPGAPGLYVTAENLRSTLRYLVDPLGWLSDVRQLGPASDGAVGGVSEDLLVKSKT